MSSGPTKTPCAKQRGEELRRGFLGGVVLTAIRSWYRSSVQPTISKLEDVLVDVEGVHVDATPGLLIAGEVGPSKEFTCRNENHRRWVFALRQRSTSPGGASTDQVNIKLPRSVRKPWRLCQVIASSSSWVVLVGIAFGLAGSPSL